MMIGEKVLALRTARGWTLQQTAAAVRAKGARRVKYQHMQQLEQYPQRVPRYLLELAAAFGMTAEQFQAWTPNQGQPQPHLGLAVSERTAPYDLDLADEIRQITIAFVVLANWVRTTKPAEAPLLHSGLSAAAKRLGVDPRDSLLAIFAQALEADNNQAAEDRAARIRGPRSVPT